MYRFAFASVWFLIVCSAWWDAFEDIWPGVVDEIRGPDRSRGEHVDILDAADTHVDFGGGDE